MNRQDSLFKLEASKNEPFDLLIIGGGATGLGAALEGASKGYKVALVEGHDFAKGTSSKSTKLAHGGVRYLAQGNFGLVRDALRERGRMRRNAPHLVHDLEFVVPAYDWWAGPYYGIGLKLYDVLAGKLGLGQSQLISRAATIERIPTIEPEGLRGGVVYFDGQFDDARLAICIAQTATHHGAVLANYVPVQRFIHHSARLSGVVVLDTESNQEITIHAKAIINATGAFTDSIRKLDDPESAPCITPSQGVHIVLPKDFLPGNAALMVPKTDDGRVLFVVPWHGKAIVGTTDTPVATTELEPRALKEEIQFLLEHAARYLSRDPNTDDVQAVYVGLRPLVKNDNNDTGITAALSRDHTIMVSRTGLITIVGGKWTTYRKMGEDVINRAATIANLETRESITANMPLHGAPERDEGKQEQPGTIAETLAQYGTDARHLRGLAEDNPSLAVPIHPKLPYLKSQVVWAVRQEMARTIEDVLARRTRSLILDARSALEAAPAVARIMAKELERGATWEETQIEAFRTRAQESLLTSSSSS